MNHLAAIGRVPQDLQNAGRVPEPLGVLQHLLTVPQVLSDRVHPGIVHRARDGPFTLASGNLLEHELNPLGLILVHGQVIRLEAEATTATRYRQTVAHPELIATVLALTFAPGFE